MLKGQLRAHLDDIEAQMEVVVAEAARMGISPFELRYADGSWPLIPLLVAKAQVLNALATLS